MQRSTSRRLTKLHSSSLRLMYCWEAKSTSVTVPTSSLAMGSCSATRCTICWMYIFSVWLLSCPKSHTSGIMLGGSACTRYTSCLSGIDPSFSLVSSALTR
uniref:Uncharacterized protein n=1 Tax=Corvus moneduloides TaxID=1196302 RepID=A0A8C3EXN4_CORMO